jgi:hypothetical protein
MQATSLTSRHRKAGGYLKQCRTAGFVALALLLAGCDNCGHWLSPLGSSIHACREQAPRPQ